MKWRSWAAALAAALAPAAAASSDVSGWRTQAAANVTASGEYISSAGFTAAGEWYPVQGPTGTVFAALVAAGEYGDVFAGENMRNVSAERFGGPWWFRAPLCTPSAPAAGAVSVLHVEGVNYRGEVWVNGQRVAGDGDVVGAFRRYTFDVSAVRPAPGSCAAVALLLHPPVDLAFPPDNNSTDLAVTFVDWAPKPPDSSLGILLPVRVVHGNPVVLRDPVVRTSVEGEDVRVALAVQVEAAAAVGGKLRLRLGSRQWCTTPVQLRAGESTLVSVDSESCSDLHFHSGEEKLWWPWQMGQPALTDLTAEFTPAGGATAAETWRVGLREVRMDLTDDGFRVLKVNGKRMLMRGAGWAPDLFLRDTDSDFRTSLLLTKHMNLNTVRLEGKFPGAAFFEAADELGLVVLAGWCCCDAWQHWAAWGEEQVLVARESMRSQLRRLRGHPSVVAFLYGSDLAPPPAIERMYLQVAANESWPNPTLASARKETSSVSGPTGVKMSGPYAWVPPSYWTKGAEERQYGGAFSFLTEGGPGASLMPLESMLRVADRDALEPGLGNAVVDFHTGNPKGVFHDLRFFNPPMVARYGEPSSLESYFQLAQVSAYEGIRAMFDAYSAYKYVSTGVIQWMLNSAWPSNYWNLYDYFLNAGGGFYAARKSCEPVQAVYSYVDRSVRAVSSQYTSVDVDVRAQLYDLSGGRRWSSSAEVRVPADGVANVTRVPKRNESGTSLLRLQVYTRGDLTTEQVYWVTDEDDELDWANSTFYITYCTKYADHTGLQKMPAVTPEVAATVSGGVVVVDLRNTDPAGRPSFFNRLRLVRNATAAPGTDVLPSLWSDNYVNVFANESRRYTVSAVGEAVADDQQLWVAVEAFNSASAAVFPVRRE